MRLIVEETVRDDSHPVPVIVFLDGDFDGQPPNELDDLIDDLLKVSGMVFGIRDKRSPNVPIWRNGERSQIMHYMAEKTGGQFLAAAPEGYPGALLTIMTQVHWRYELAVRPSETAGRRREIRVTLTNEAHQDVIVRTQSTYMLGAKYSYAQ